jgi:hypothetical protein
MLKRTFVNISLEFVFIRKGCMALFWSVVGQKQCAKRGERRIKCLRKAKGQLTRSSMLIYTFILKERGKGLCVFN